MQEDNKSCSNLQLFFELHKQKPNLYSTHLCNAIGPLLSIADTSGTHIVVSLLINMAATFLGVTMRMELKHEICNIYSYIQRYKGHVLLLRTIQRYILQSLGKARQQCFQMKLK